MNIATECHLSQENCKIPAIGVSMSHFTLLFTIAVKTLVSTEQNDSMVQTVTDLSQLLHILQYLSCSVADGIFFII